MCGFGMDLIFRVAIFVIVLLVVLALLRAALADGSPVLRRALLERHSDRDRRRDRDPDPAVHLAAGGCAGLLAALVSR